MSFTAASASELAAPVAAVAGHGEADVSGQLRRQGAGCVTGRAAGPDRVWPGGREASCR